MEDDREERMVSEESTEKLLEWFKELKDTNHLILAKMEVIAKELAARAQRTNLNEELLALYRQNTIQHARNIIYCRDALQPDDASKKRQQVFISSLYFMTKICFREY